MRTGGPATLLLGLVLALALAVTACSVGGGTRPSGNIQTQPRQVPDFDSINFTGLGTLTVEQSGSDSVQVQADDNVLPQLSSSVNGTTLQLGIQPGASLSGIPHITYHVTVKQLRGLVCSGAGTATATSVDAPAVALAGSDACTLNVSGRTTTENIDLVGAGTVDAGGLAAQTADVSVDGAGTATVNAARTLSATVTGLGTITYLGNPALTQNITGLGSIRRQ